MKLTPTRDLYLSVVLLFSVLGCFNDHNTHECKLIDTSYSDNTFEEEHSIVYDSPSSEGSHSSLDESKLNDLKESMLAEICHFRQAIDQKRYEDKELLL